MSHVLLSKIGNYCKTTAIIAFLVVQCGNLDENKTGLTVKNATQYMGVITAKSITLYWDAPPWYIDTVKYYQVMYSTQSDTSWKVLINNIPIADSPKIVVYRDSIKSNDSIIFLGARYMANNNTFSTILSSLDSTTIPSGGWLLYWKK